MPATAAHHCGEWPRVYILGAQKGATTSIASSLTWQALMTSAEGGRAKDNPCCRAAPHHVRCDQETHFFGARLAQCAADSSEAACAAEYAR